MNAVLTALLATLIVILLVCLTGMLMAVRFG